MAFYTFVAVIHSRLIVFLSLEYQFEEEDIFNLMDGYKLRDLGSDSHSHVLVKAKAMESLLIVLETRKGYDGYGNFLLLLYNFYRD